MALLTLNASLPALEALIALTPKTTTKKKIDPRLSHDIRCDVLLFTRAQ
jgi:hypothetical protein